MVNTRKKQSWGLFDGALMHIYSLTFTLYQTAYIMHHSANKKIVFIIFMITLSPNIDAIDCIYIVPKQIC